MVDEIEEWTCPICLDLAYKPVVNTCGHTFCFWCLHRCMNFPTFRDEELPWAENRCPTCRGELLRLPAVCEALHHYLQHAFPTEYDRREAIVTEDEEKRRVQSLAIKRLPHSEESEVFCRNIFACSNCGEVGSETLVLNCGHLICGPACQLHRCKTCSSRITAPSRCPKMRQVICQKLPEAGLQGKSPRSIDASVAAAIEETAAEGQMPAFTPARHIVSGIHHGVGCDGCGILPIRGKRYKCLDCPEAIGFDLCGACYAHGLDFSQTRGRFNQQHTSSHRMQLMKKTAPPDISFLDGAIRPLLVEEDGTIRVRSYLESESESQSDSGSSSGSGSGSGSGSDEDTEADERSEASEGPGEDSALPETDNEALEEDC